MLNAKTIAIQSIDGRRTATFIPEGAIVQVQMISGPRALNRMIDVLWEGRTLSVFAEDILLRSEEVRSVKERASA